MSKVSEIREVCGDYAIDIKYSKDFTFTMFFNSRRNAQTVKRCVEVDDSVPNVATPVDFVEVVRCKDCIHAREVKHRGEVMEGIYRCSYTKMSTNLFDIDYCRYGKRREENEG